MSTAVYVVLLSAVMFMYSRLRSIEAHVDMLMATIDEWVSMRDDVDMLTERVDKLHVEADGGPDDEDEDEDEDGDEDDDDDDDDDDDEDAVTVG